MESLRQIGTGIVLAIISIVIVLGGFALASAEGRLATGATPYGEIQATFTTVLTSLPEVSDTLQPIIVTASATPTVTETSTELPSPTTLPSITPTAVTAVCPPPYGWIAVIVEPYDTLSSLALKYQMSQDAIRAGNCLISDQIQAGSLLYVLPLPLATQKYATNIPCGAPYSWVDYYVVPGDTLYNLSVRYRVTVSDLQIANCLGSSTNIRVGQRIKVPYAATAEPPSTLTPAPTELPTSIPTATTEVPPTVETPLPTIEPSPTDLPPTEVTPAGINDPFTITPTPYSGIQ